MRGFLDPLRAWKLYDWADSAFVTTVVAAVLPAYFAGVVCGGGKAGFDVLGARVGGSPTSLWGYAVGAAAAVVAVLSPVLGAVADAGGRRKLFLGVFAACGMAASAALSLAGPGMVAFTLAMLAAGEVGFAGAQVFYNSLLVGISPPEGRDRASAGGFAWGYLGGGILLAINLVMIRKPELFGLEDAAAASRASFISVAVWWALFSVPLFTTVPEGAARTSARSALREGLSTLSATVRALPRRRNLLLFLTAFLLYNDGIQTVILMATVFGKAELGLDTGDLVAALLLTQAVGVPGSMLYGRAASRFGAKRSILAGIAAYMVIVLAASRMRTAAEFTVLACAVGVFQGGLQAVSRSMYSRLIPAGLAAEYFGLFSVSSRFASILGPLMFAAVRDMTGSARVSILATLILFAAGGSVLATVREEDG